MKSVCWEMLCGQRCGQGSRGRELVRGGHFVRAFPHAHVEVCIWWGKYLAGYDFYFSMEVMKVPLKFLKAEIDELNDRPLASSFGVQMGWRELKGLRYWRKSPSPDLCYLLVQWMSSFSVAKVSWVISSNMWSWCYWLVLSFPVVSVWSVVSKWQ